MTDVLKLTPGSNADIANLFIQKLDHAVHNRTVSSLVLVDTEVFALLNYISDLELEIMTLRATYEDK